jgi:hypothetical protein
VIVHVLDPTESGAAVARARKAGLRVFSFVRPGFRVDGSPVYPNFNQGTYMAEHLADRLKPTGRTCSHPADQSARREPRVDATCNPYLAAAAYLQAGA